MFPVGIIGNKVIKKDVKINISFNSVLFFLFSIFIYKFFKKFHYIYQKNKGIKRPIKPVSDNS